MHYLNYDPVIETFDSPSFEKIVASGKCFVRKVRTGVSDELIERINKWREVSTLASDLRD